MRSSLATVFAPLLLAATLVAGPARAGFEVGNGGQGVVLGERIYLLDLVESGIERDPVVRRDAVSDGAWSSRLGAALSGIDDAPLALVAAKLQEIRALHPTLAFSLLLASESLRWLPVESELESIPDRVGVIETGRYEIVQLAVRAGRSVRIHRPSWKRLDEVNRAALLVHELVYSLIEPSRREDGFSEQSAVRAREITAFLFSRSLSRGGASALGTIIGEAIAAEPAYARLIGHGGFEQAELIIVLSVPVPNGEYGLVARWDPRQAPAGAAERVCSDLANVLQRRKVDQPARVEVALARRHRNLSFNEWVSPRGPQSGLRVGGCMDLRCAELSPMAERTFRGASQAGSCRDWLTRSLEGSASEFARYETQP